MNKTIRVAITSERINNRSYELTAKTFLDLTLFELCTPIVYGSKKDAEAVFKSLETQPNWTSVRQAEEAQDGRLNIIDTPADTARQRIIVAEAFVYAPGRSKRNLMMALQPVVAVERERRSASQGLQEHPPPRLHAVGSQDSLAPTRRP